MDKKERYEKRAKNRKNLFEKKQKIKEMRIKTKPKLVVPDIKEGMKLDEFFFGNPKAEEELVKKETPWKPEPFKPVSIREDKQ